MPIKGKTPYSQPHSQIYGDSFLNKTLNSFMFDSFMFDVERNVVFEVGF
jgi:hypothetical protein